MELPVGMVFPKPAFVVPPGWRLLIDFRMPPKHPLWSSNYNFLSSSDPMISLPIYPISLFYGVSVPETPALPELPAKPVEDFPEI